MRIAIQNDKRGIVLAGLLAAVLAGAAAAADVNEVRVTHDPDIAARTNMGRNPTDTGVLGVTFDKDVAARTNMQRDPGDVGAVGLSPDMAVRERTNMGGIAKKEAPAQQQTDQAAASR
jgi:hypothetical protein